jgi:superfamily II DNA/RNA helicase
MSKIIDESNKKEDTNNSISTLNFENLGLNKDLLKGVYLYGFTEPSKIQMKGITTINTGVDCIIQSQSGTGKTATYLLGVFNRLNSDTKLCQGIIITPTRELAIQVHEVATHLTKFIDHNIVLCIGGTDINQNRNDIKKASVIIGTLGRIYHMIIESKFNIMKIKFIVLDEADDLLYNGIDQKLKMILEKATSGIQNILISATITNSVFNLSRQYMHNPVKILLRNNEIMVELISQFYLDVNDENQKFDMLLDLYSLVSTSQAIIFSNTINKIVWLEENLKKNNFPITVLHSNMTSNDRHETMKDFRDGKTRLLLTTDLLSRGIDIPMVNMVINYDLPFTKENYVHRIGRCGRFSKRGIAVSFVKSSDPADMKILNTLIKYYKINIKEMPDNIETYLN